MEHAIRRIEEIVDLETYPIDRLESAAGRTLIEGCRAELDRAGLFNLAGFVFPDLVRDMVPDLQPLFDQQAFTHRRRHNVYFLPEVEGLAADHPALREMETVNHTVCADQVPHNPLLQLYEWPPFAAFLAAVMGKRQLYPMDDPLACVNFMAYRDGESLNWHFDRSEFTTTLLLQAAEAGGEFQYRTGLRSDTDPNYDGIGQFLSGNQSDVNSVKLSAGTLNVFRGKNTLHRVSPVRGSRNRMITVFSYYETSGVRFTPQENLGFYGRAGADR